MCTDRPVFLPVDFIFSFISLIFFTARCCADYAYAMVISRPSIRPSVRLAVGNGDIP